MPNKIRRAQRRLFHCFKSIHKPKQLKKICDNPTNTPGHILGQTLPQTHVRVNSHLVTLSVDQKVLRHKPKYEEKEPVLGYNIFAITNNHQYFLWRSIKPVITYFPN